MTRALLLFITAMMLFLTPPPAAVAQVAEQPAAQAEAS
jgi:hypothetical protein